MIDGALFLLLGAALLRHGRRGFGQFLEESHDCFFGRAVTARGAEDFKLDPAYPDSAPFPYGAEHGRLSVSAQMQNKRAIPGLLQRQEFFFRNVDHAIPYLLALFFGVVDWKSVRSH